MGGTSRTHETTRQTTRTQPTAGTEPALVQLAGGVTSQLANYGLSPAEQAAFGELENNARAGNPYAPQVGQLAADLFTGGPDRSGMAATAYDDYRAGLTPYTTASTNPYDNAAFVNAAGVMRDDILDRVKSGYAGAGYSPAATGDFARSVGEGVARGIAPTWLQAYNDLENRKLGAIRDLHAGANTTVGLLSGLDQAALANRRAGVDVATAALRARDAGPARLLELAQSQWATPMQRLAAANDMIVPLARAFGTTETEGERSGTSQLSPAQQAWGWMNAFANLGRGLFGGRGGGGGSVGGSWGGDVGGGG